MPHSTPVVASSRKRWPRTVGVLGLLLLPAVVVALLLTARPGGSGGQAGSSGGAAPSTANPSAPAVPPLDGQGGVYAFPIGSDARLARAAGIDYAIVDYVPGRDRGLPIVDRTPESLLYHSMCPGGPTKCHTLDAAELQKLVERVKRQVARDIHSDSVIGVYLTDDYWTDMHTVLPTLHEAIRREGFQKPMVCGLGASLRLRSDPGRVPDRQMQLGLRNYSPAWCDAVFLYVYKPPGKGPPSSAYDWTMRVPLREAMTGLRRRGYQPGRSLLIGGIQAFQYDAAIRPKGKEPEYWAGPDRAQLVTQAVSFCRNGARSITAYTWNDGMRGGVRELYNSPMYRSAVKEGIDTCRAKYW